MSGLCQRGRGPRVVAAVLQEGVCGERRIRLPRLEGGRVGREHVERAVLQRRRRAVAFLVRPPPVLVAVWRFADECPSVRQQEGADVAATVVVVARPLFEAAEFRRRRGLRRPLLLLGHLVQRPRRVQKRLPLRLRQRGETGVTALFQDVSWARRTQDEAAFAARLDERGPFPVPHARRQLEVAAYRRRAAVRRVESARRRPFDDKPVEQLLRQGFRPFREQFAVVVEVDGLQIARDGPAHDADGCRPRRGPCVRLLNRRQAALVFLP